MPDIRIILLDTFRKILEQFTGFIPRFIGFLLLLGVGWVVTRIVSVVIVNVLSRIGLDRLGEKLQQIDIVRRFAPKLKLSRLTARTISFFVTLVFVMAATETLGMPVITELVGSLVALIPRVIAAIIMLILGLLASDYVRKMVTNLCLSLGIRSGRLIGSGVFVFLLMITLIASLGQAGINTSLLESSFNWLIGGLVVAFGVGYGMASRDVLSNLLASFYTKNRYREGQTIAINGVRGVIVAIDNTSLTLQTEGHLTVFPLHMLQNQKVEIFS